MQVFFIQGVQCFETLAGSPAWCGNGNSIEDMKGSTMQRNLTTTWTTQSRKSVSLQINDWLQYYRPCNATDRWLLSGDPGYNELVSSGQGIVNTLLSLVEPQWRPAKLLIRWRHTESAPVVSYIWVQVFFIRGMQCFCEEQSFCEEHWKLEFVIVTGGPGYNKLRPETTSGQGIVNSLLSLVEPQWCTFPSID